MHLKSSRIISFQAQDLVLEKKHFDSLSSPGKMAATFGISTGGNGKRTTKLRQLTENNTKILGSNITKKLEKTLPASKFQTRSFKTLNSAYTPIVHKPSNEQVGECFDISGDTKQTQLKKYVVLDLM